MRFSRRTFMKSSAAVGGGALVAGGLVGGELETLVQAGPTAQAAPTEELVPTACWIGKQDCGVLARRIDGRVVSLQGHPAHPRNLGTLCPKGVAQITSLYDPARLKTPLVRTNEKGVTGTWREASWDEALQLVADRLKQAMAKDKRLTGFVPGRTKVGAIYDTAFRAATGIPYSYGRRGNDCGGAHEDAVLATWGDRGVISPDLERCNYLICYWNLTQAGGPGLCQIAYPRMVADARARGMKVVAINPYARPVAHFADEWVPIKPGMDMAFWLAVINVLLSAGYVDATFLKAHTNAPSLVRDDGTVLTEGESELVWDASAGAAVPYGPGVDPALTGAYEVGGVRARPSFQVLQDHVQQYTPEWAAGVCGVRAEQIERIARDLGRNAMIGSTVAIDGVNVPYRPVAFGMHGTATKLHSSLQTNRAILLAFMLLGAIEAAGGPHFWEKRVEEPAKAQEGWLKAATKETPDRLDLGGTKWFPLGASGYHMFAEVTEAPERYGLPYRPEDMALVVDFVNPLMTARPREKMLQAWKRFGFVAVVTPYMSVTAEYAADVVLPCGTLDKWEGPLTVKTLYASGETVRAPVMEPIGQSRSETEIYAGIAEKMGKLYGPNGFVDQVNKALAIKEPYLLPLDQKLTPQQMLEAWARSKHGIGLEQVQSRGVVSSKVPVDRLYLSVANPPYRGVRAHFYVEAFLKLGQELQRRGVHQSLWSHYAPLPTWTQPPMEAAPADYDLYLMDFKRIEHKHARTTANPLLHELFGTNPLIMHLDAAGERGLADGDPVWVESHNPVTGEARRIKTTLATVEGIRPDTVAITHHVSRLDQPSANDLFFFSDGFWDIGGGWFSHVKVKVWRAEGGSDA